MRLANPKVARSKNLIPASKEAETVVEAGLKNLFMNNN